MGNQKESTQSWLESLDAMTAAPEHHRVLLENDRVRVLEAWIAAGDTVPLHSHRWPSVIHVISASDFVRYDPQGCIAMDSRTLPSRPKSGDILWSAPLQPHSIQNVGDTELRVIAIELKHAASADAVS